MVVEGEGRTPSQGGRVRGASRAGVFTILSFDGITLLDKLLNYTITSLLNLVFGEI